MAYIGALTAGKGTMVKEGVVSFATDLSISTSIYRTGGASYEVPSLSSGTATAGRYVIQAAAYGNYRFKFHLYVTTTPSVVTTIFSALEGSPYDNRYQIRLNTDRSIGVWTSTSTQVGSDSSALSADTWHCIEMRVDTTGGAGNTIIQCRIDEASAFVDVSNNAQYRTTSGIEIGGNIEGESSTTGRWFFDDIVITQGEAGWEGKDSKCFVVLPNAAGDETDWTGDYTDIDESTPNDATDYIEGDTNGWLEDVNCESTTTVGIGGSDTINCVLVYHRFRSETAAKSQINARIKSASGGTVSESSAVSTAVTDWHTCDDGTSKGPKLTAATRPEGGAWTPAYIDSMQIGVDAYDATPDVWVTALWAVVIAVPAAGETVTMDKWYHEPHEVRVGAPVPVPY